MQRGMNQFSRSNRLTNGFAVLKRLNFGRISLGYTDVGGSHSQN